jgi:hypothetical protein
LSAFNGSLHRTEEIYAKLENSEWQSPAKSVETLAQLTGYRIKLLLEKRGYIRIARQGQHSE